ncbi:hypothetical protein ACSNOH_24260 [Streptomyces sp. URMC 127]|uniref:hypothetical protein n=1 Tax=Streptomyces sp. URMC 127 TaxID=3423402 RepID=UPI003F1B32B9
MSEQRNTARESGVQYITSTGDINVYPPRGGGGRFTKRRVLPAAGAIVAAAATAVALALLPSSPPAAGGSARPAAGAPARSGSPSASVSPRTPADSRASAAPERPESAAAAAPSAVRAPAREAATHEARPAPRPTSWSDSYADGTVCAGGNRWTPVPGMTGVDFQPCTYAKSYSGKALFGVKVRNSSPRQVAVAGWVGYRMSEQEHDCSPPFLQNPVVIDPGKTWSSQLTKCIATIEGAHRVQARAGVSEEGGSPRSSRLEYSRGVDILADGRAVPVPYRG